MKNFNLNFKEKTIEEEYRLLKDQTKVETFRITLGFWSAEIMCFIAESITNRNREAILIEIGILLSFFVMACFAKKVGKYIEHLTILIQILLTVAALLLILANRDKMSELMMFVNGFYIASLQIVIPSRFSRLRSKILYILFSYGFRFGLLGHLDSGLIEPFVLGRCFVVEGIVMYVFFSNEKKERLTFQSFYNYRQEFQKFKELVANYLTQGITIVDCKNQEVLFSNQTFQGLQKDLRNDILILSENSGLGSEMPANFSIFDRLSIQENTLRQINASQVYEGPLKQAKNFNELIKLLSSEPNMKDNAFAVGLETAKRLNKRVFEATLISITWGQDDAIAVILNDITYQEKILSLKIADANKDKVIATVSHELRTPLNGIIGILHMVHNKVKDHEVLEYLTLCEDNANLLLNLVNSLLDLHQIHQQKLKLNLSEVIIDNLFKETLRLFSFQAESKGIYLNLKIAGDMPVTIYTDENRLRQVLINLIGNALKFTLKGGITVHITQDPYDDDYIQISVIDTGLGIREEDKDKLFKMYGRLENNESVNKTGVGLGLTTSNALVKLLCGTNDSDENQNGIMLESKVGIGSEFKFRILKDLKVVPEAKKDKFEAVLERMGESRDDSQDDEARVQSLKLNMDFCDEAKISPRSQMSSYLFFQKHQMMPELSYHTSKTFTKKTRTPSDKGWSSSEELMKSGLSEDRVYSNFKVEVKRGRFYQDSPSHTPLISRDKGEILVVDDNSFNLLIAKHFVENLGYAVETAMNGKEAIDKIKLRCPSLPALKLILMDCQMPVMDGFEASEILTEMMERGEIHSVPIVALTANTSEEDKKRCLDSGMVDHLAKPLVIGTLSDVLSKFEV